MDKRPNISEMTKNQAILWLFPEAIKDKRDEIKQLKKWIWESSTFWGKAKIVIDKISSALVIAGIVIMAEWLIVVLLVLIYG